MADDAPAPAVRLPRIGGHVTCVTRPTVDPARGDPRDAPHLPDLVCGLDAAMELARGCACCRSLPGVLRIGPSPAR